MRHRELRRQFDCLPFHRVLQQNQYLTWWSSGQLRQLANKLANRGTGGDRRECRLRSRRVWDTRHRFRGRVGRRNVGICVLLRSHFHPSIRVRRCAQIRIAGDGQSHRDWVVRVILIFVCNRRLCRCVRTGGEFIFNPRSALRALGFGQWGEGKDGWRPVRMSQIGKRR